MENAIFKCLVVAFVVIGCVYRGMSLIDDMSINSDGKLMGMVENISKTGLDYWEIRVGGFDLYGGDLGDMQVGDIVEIDMIRKENESWIGGSYLVIDNIEIVNKYDKGVVSWRVWIEVEFKMAVNSVRNWLEGRVMRLFAEKDGGVVLGVIGGIKHRFNKDFKQALVDVGLIHLFVASGGNIVLVRRLMEVILDKISNMALKLWLLNGTIFLYVLLLGFDPPMIRAGLVYVVSWIYLYLGRKVILAWSVFVIFCATVLIDPRVVFDISFLMSLVAWIGLVTVGQAGKDLLKIYGCKSKVGKYFVVSLFDVCGVMILLVPFILAINDDINLMAIGVNLLVTPIVPLVVIVSVMAVGASIFSVSLAQVVLLPGKVLIKYIVVVVEYFASNYRIDVEMEMTWYWAIAWWFGWVIVIYMTKRFLVKKMILKGA